MDLGEVLLGLAGIALGYKTLSGGAVRLSNGLARPGSGMGRVPTVIVPRAATRALPPVRTQSARMPTKAGQMRVTLREVNTLGDRLSIIINQANEGKVDPRIIAWARKEISRKKPGSSAWNGEQWEIPEKRKDLEAVALFRAVRRDHRYLSDVVGYDTFSKPGKTRELGGEDCDGLSTLLAAGLMSVGIPARFKVIETKQSTSGPDHIFTQALINGQWVSFDPSVNMGPGWEAPPSMVKRAWVFETD